MHNLYTTVHISRADPLLPRTPMPRRALLTAVAILASATAPLAAQQPAHLPAHHPAPTAGLDQYIERAMHDWHVPGLAIAIVHNDSVVLARGYGVRDIGKPDRVDPHTIFAIGSNSKAFTATAIAMMVDSGRMHWDDRATQYLPGFQLYDPFVTREITVRDLLSHRSGLGRRGDLLWYGSPYSRAEILRRIRYLPPNSSFRSQFGYSNIMVLAAGQALAAAPGAMWTTSGPRAPSIPPSPTWRSGSACSSATARTPAGSSSRSGPSARPTRRRRSSPPRTTRSPPRPTSSSTAWAGCSRTIAAARSSGTTVASMACSRRSVSSPKHTWASSSSPTPKATI